MGNLNKRTSEWEQKWATDDLIFVDDEAKAFQKSAGNLSVHDAQATRSLEHLREIWDDIFDGTPVGDKDVEKELLTGIPELKQKNLQSTRTRLSKAGQHFKAKHYLRDLDAHSRFIIGTYCDNHVYPALNKSLRENQYTIFQSYFKHLVQALRALPYERVDGLYRGIPTKMEKGTSIQSCWSEDDFEVGQLLTWHGFTSTSKDRAIARRFAGPNGVIFRIKVDTGRDISAFSKFKEEEVLLLPLTMMQVQKIETVRQNIIVELEEIQIWKGKHCVLWIDDYPENNFCVMQAAERASDVNFVMVRSTNEALRFFQYASNEEVKDLDMSRFRVVTDMHRDTEPEDEKEIAGAIVCKKLQELGYSHNIMVFVSHASRTLENIQNQGLSTEKIIVTSDPERVMDFCCFV